MPFEESRSGEDIIRSREGGSTDNIIPRCHASLPTPSINVAPSSTSSCPRCHVDSQTGCKRCPTFTQQYSLDEEKSCGDLVTRVYMNSIVVNVLVLCNKEPIIYVSYNGFYCAISVISCNDLLGVFAILCLFATTLFT